MPTQVQNNIVLPPIQKFVPPPEPPAQDAAPRKGEEFGEALKTARKKKGRRAGQNAARKRKDEGHQNRVEEGRRFESRGQELAKPATKVAPSAKSSKPGKSKTTSQDDSGEIDDIDTAAHAEDPAAADEAAQTATTDETQIPTATPQAKTPATAKDDPDHPDQTDPTAAAATAASAHLIQAVDRAKDQNRREKNPDETADADEIANTTVRADAATATNTAASGAISKTADETRPAVPTQSPAAQTVPNTTHTKAASIDLGGDAPIEIKPVAPTKPPANANDASSAIDASVQVPQPPDSPDDAPADAKGAKLSLDLDPIARAVLESQGHTTQPSGVTSAPKTADAPPLPPEVQFAQSNHDKIVTGVQTQLLPHGGTMEIRLDPPELGALKVMVEMRDGVMSATFQTSSEEATQLLSHSLNQLKHVLESQGVSVERLQVQQAPKSDSSSTKDDPNQRQQQGTADDHAARQEQQRKEMMRRMWRRVSGAGDPIDYLA